jgi:hypothetical protein
MHDDLFQNERKKYAKKFQHVQKQVEINYQLDSYSLKTERQETRTMIHLPII